MDRVLRKNPEDEATNSIEGKPGVRYFAREPGENPGVPGVTLLYTVEPDRVVVWAVRIEDPHRGVID